MPPPLRISSSASPLPSILSDFFRSVEVYKVILVTMTFAVGDDVFHALRFQYNNHVAALHFIMRCSVTGQSIVMRQNAKYFLENEPRCEDSILTVY